MDNVSPIPFLRQPIDRFASRACSITVQSLRYFYSYFFAFYSFLPGFLHAPFISFLAIIFFYFLTSRQIHPPFSFSRATPNYHSSSCRFLRSLISSTRAKISLSLSVIVPSLPLIETVAIPSWPPARKSGTASVPFTIFVRSSFYFSCWQGISYSRAEERDSSFSFTKKFLYLRIICTVRSGTISMIKIEYNLNRFCTRFFPFSFFFLIIIRFAACRLIL